MQLRAAVVVSLAALVLSVTACNDDGRTLRPARPDQNGSVSTLPPVTDPPVVDPELDDGFDVSETLPGASATAGTGVYIVTSSFLDGDPIDPRHTCQGEDVSPVLSWTPAPTGTVEIAITMVDLDAPDFVHWAIAGIDPLSQALGEGVVPEYSMQGLNGLGVPGYTGPCPPVGETHSYRITVHYLAQQTELGDGALGADLIASIEGSTFASASTTGTYSQG